jgi:uncharacterized RDD family membrane protein YckC
MYPSILRRYLSTAIDLVLIAALTYAFLKSPFFSPEDSESPLWLFLGLLACEPVLTAFACTPGQFLMNLRVRNAKTLGRPSLLSIVARSLVKMFLGVISIIFIPSQKQRRGLHDIAARTIVLSGSGPYSLPPGPSGERTRAG